MRKESRKEPRKIKENRENRGEIAEKSEKITGGKNDEKIAKITYLYISVIIDGTSPKLS